MTDQGLATEKNKNIFKDDEVYTNGEFCDILKLKRATVKKWRHIKKFNPPSFKAGGGVRYKGSDLNTWVNENMKDVAQ